MTKLGGSLYLAIGVLLGIGACALLIWNPFGWTQIDHLLGRHGPAHETGEDGETLYTCGMHPQFVQDEPGSCPICGLKLVPIQDPAPQSTESERKILYWRAPIDPNYTSEQPGKSPMGMDLIPVYEDKIADEGGVRVSPNFLQNFAVRTTEVKQGALPVEIRTVGILAHNEEKVVSINTKFEGWIEQARVNNIGERVVRGEVLFEIYSPDLVTTQREFLAAMEYADQLATGKAYPAAVERATSLLQAARERLLYWDVTEEQIEALEESKQIRRTVEFVSPSSGFIVDKIGDSLEGMKVMPGLVVLKLADHATLWAEVEFYEGDLRHVQEGRRVSVEVGAFPGRRWSGRIVLFRPSLNPETRTLTALVEVANPDLRLRPQMYANVTARSGGASNAILVPAQAVLHSGERTVVIVAKGGGLFEPREVDLGHASGDMQQVTKGLRPGEIVVTSSQFLIDSESNLKAVITQLLGKQGGAETSEPMPMGQRP